MNYYTRIVLALAFSVSFAGCATTGDGEAQKISVEENSPAEPYVRMGVGYMNRGNLDVALAKLTYALKVDSGYSEAHNAIAVLYERLKLPDEARDHYEKGLRVNSANFGLLNNYGRFLCEQGDYQEAERYFQRAIALPLNDRPWFAMTNAGRCLRLAGRPGEAEAHLRAALEKNPNFAPALLEMLKISFGQKNFMSARAFLQRYHDVARPTSETLWLGIQSETALGNAALVEEYGEALLEDFPQSDEASRYRALKL